MKGGNNRALRSDKYAFNWQDYQGKDTCTLVLHYDTIKWSYKKWSLWSGYDSIVSFLHALASSDPHVNVFSIGQTTEGRDMNVIGITRAGKGRPNVYIEAGEEEEFIKTKYWF